MTLDLTDEETAALERLLGETINADRYPLSLRILTLKAILARSGPSPCANLSRRCSITSRRRKADIGDAARSLARLGA